MKKIINDFILEFKEQIKSIKTDGWKRQIPNMLTFSRAIAPLIIIPTVFLGRLDIAIIELILFEITDFLDGRLARKFGIVSEFGIKLDAVCDKLFALGIIIPVIIKYPVLLINLILEICISYISMLSEIKDNNPRTNMIGKVKSTFLSITLVVAYIPAINRLYVLLLSILTFMLQIWAFVKYREIDIDKDIKKK